MKIYIGSGKVLFTVKLMGFEFESRAVPIGGVVVATHQVAGWLRLKHFAFILAGPVVNILLVAAVWRMIGTDQLWTVKPMEQGPQPALAFLYANLLVLVVNLWPHDVATGLGVIASDGKQLLLTPFLTREKRALMYTMNFVMEAAACRQRGDYERALCSVEKGLAHLPDNDILLNLEGVYHRLLITDH